MSRKFTVTKEIRGDPRWKKAEPKIRLKKWAHGVDFETYWIYPPGAPKSASYVVITKPYKDVYHIFVNADDRFDWEAAVFHPRGRSEPVIWLDVLVEVLIKNVVSPWGRGYFILFLYVTNDNQSHFWGEFTCDDLTRVSGPYTTQVAEGEARPNRNESRSAKHK